MNMYEFGIGHSMSGNFASRSGIAVCTADEAVTVFKEYAVNRQHIDAAMKILQVRSPAIVDLGCGLQFHAREI